MLHFFRKIRRELLANSQTIRYLKYGIGEILLVVIGILIAIQVDNWNEERIVQERIRSYSTSLIEDLKKDIEEAEIRKEQIDWRIRTWDSVFPFFRDKSIDDINNVDVVFTLGYYINYRALTWHKNTIDELKSSGSLQYIQNDSLKGSIAQYYSFLDHLSEDYIVDFNLANSIANNIRGVANLNYPKNLLDSMAALRHKKPFNEIFSSNLYQEALDYDYTLLTNDIRDIQFILNQLQQMRRSLGHRQVEYPRVIEYAKGIIETLEQSYLEN